MTVDIITVYNTENCGSALQAYALSKFLRDQLTEKDTVRFVYRNLADTPNSGARCFAGCAKQLLLGSVSQARRRFHRYRDFRTFQRKHFLVTKTVSENDFIVIGSDTLWNLKSHYFASNRDFFWGKQYPNQRKMSYAVSVCNSDKSLFADPFYSSAIDSFEQISVRDAHSQEAISPITGKEITITCDPTLLLSADDYDEICASTQEQNYILVYYFGDIESACEQEIIRIAKENHLRMISFGRERKWCDVCVENNPGNFLAYFKNARFVVTNTFHGTVFSVIYRKRFCAFVKKKIKARDFLCSIGLENHITEKASDIAPMYHDETIHSIEVEKNLSSIVKHSKQFIKDFLGGNER